ncbi:uncharacterized protein BDR25DRAFT_346306 [Lindgomyces ingoldianus]|uniref:Uncharacterized protein n=1 Tax=Lindgomyces ingoldianus TaxID=673940 RepID=A0ACB6QE97_9PLEO|nr:uncharacterized protein BDR25DRAFT_346306 [Lindgomyces ingoldianus]KAF2465234.1 hypothetical protein BDR25DRAFT_346306 [Lindgomyces ingoldianus]
MGMLWLLLNIIAQTGIATLSLTWSANPGQTNLFRDSSIGNMLVPNMSVYASHSGRFSDLHGALPELFAAHILGDIASSYNYSNLPSKPLKDRPEAFSPAVFWNASDHWQYNFLDSAPLKSGSASSSADSSSISMYTEHTVNVSGVCQTPAFTLNSTERLQIITITNTGEIVFFPPLAGLQESIFYLTNPILDEPRANCGPRCGVVKVIEAATGPPAPGSDPSSKPFYYYDCNITVSAATTNLSDTNAIVAAQAIALSGQVHQGMLEIGRRDQFMSYNNGLPFGESQNNSATGMADLISRFAIGVVAAAAQTNPKVVVQGHAPVQGVRLELEKPLVFNLILILTAAIHSVLFCSAAWFYSRLDVRKEAVLSQTDGERRFAVEFALKTK